MAVHYNSRSIAPLRLPVVECRVFYAAYRRFGELLRERAFQLTTRLEAGDLVLFDNQRILHGRTGFASARHPRHLRGCYLTRDSVFSQAALLQRSGRSAEEEHEHQRGAVRDLRAAWRVRAHFGEDVTIAEHSLQAAYFAQAADAPEALVVAALLHDVGHLLGRAPDDSGRMDRGCASRADWRGMAREAFRPGGCRARAAARAGETLSMRHGLKLLRQAPTRLHRRAADPRDPDGRSGSAATAPGYGLLVDDPHGCKIEIVPWPARSRRASANTGDRGGIRAFRFSWRATSSTRATTPWVTATCSPGHLAEQATTQRSAQARDQALIWRANFHHPDGGQLFFTIGAELHRCRWRCPRGRRDPESFTTFYCDGSRQALPASALWHGAVGAAR